MCAQAASKTNDTAGDGTTTATILSAAIIAEGMKIVAAGTNPIQVIALTTCSPECSLSSSQAAKLPGWEHLNMEDGVIRAGTPRGWYGAVHGRCLRKPK